VWLLGSGGSSAHYAAEMGCGYSFAQFISGQDGAGQVRYYRERFRPSASRAEPAASVALGVICAETQAQAQRLASSLELWRMRIMHGRDRGIPSPDEALAELGTSWTPPRLGEDGARMIAGDPAQVRDELHRVAERYGVEELMIVTVTHDWAARVRSYELIAEAMGMEPRSA
jgi:luciferase family oxidoreductase group 1